MRRAFVSVSGGRFAARIEMKMRLSMPSTSSRAVRVARAFQISGFASCSMVCAESGSSGGEAAPAGAGAAGRDGSEVEQFPEQGLGLLPAIVGLVTVVTVVAA